MKRLSGFVGGVALGVGVMFLLDPVSGRRRRHLIWDKLIRGRREISEAADTTATRIRNKARGLVAQTRSRFSTQEVDDSVLEARVRASMGHVLSNPGAMAIQARGGVVTVSGPLLAAEADRLLSCISAVPGVHEVRSQLQFRTSGHGAPGLPGKRESRNRD